MADNKDATPSKEELEKQFCDLSMTYTRTCEAVEGTGGKGQHYIDNEYDNLKKFVSQYPEFQSRIPELYRCRDDGDGGSGAGMATLGSSFHRRGEDCSIQ